MLLVTDNRFWRRGIGSEQRIASLHEHLVARGWNVAVLFVGRLHAADRRTLDETGQIARVYDIDSPLLPSRLRWRRRLGELVPQRVRQLVRDALAPRQRSADAARPPPLTAVSPYLRAVATTVARRHAPHVVLVEYARLASLAALLRAAAPPGCALVVDTLDVVHQRASSFTAVGVPADHAMTADEERDALEPFDGIIAITAQDAAVLSGLQPGKPCIVAPHAVDVHVVARATEDTAVAFGFIGSAMMPNVDAARWLLNDIWPRVRAAAPTARLVIAGAVGEALDAGVAPGSGVECLGRVADPAEFYRRIDVALCPIRYGSGLKIKNVEALGAGRPLVTTPEGAWGLPAAVGAGYVVARTAAAFAEEMVRLAADAPARDELAARAARAARESFAAAAAYGDLDRHLDALHASAASARAPEGAAR
jgi:glycosyltransferase involved in cell wall biosynthesis